MSTNRIRVMFVSLLAVFAVSAVVSSSASAAHGYWVCKEGAASEPPVKYDNHECNTQVKPLAERKWEWLEVKGTEKFSVEGESAASKLEGEVAGLKTIVECKKDKFKGEIEKEGKSKGEITFETCEFFEVKNHVKTAVANCTVPPITFKFIDALVQGQGLGPATWGPEDQFNPETGETFVEIKIEGASCVLKGTYKATQHEVAISEGTTTVKYKGQVCALPEAGVGKVVHEIVCTSTGSHLTFNGKAAYFFSTDPVHLVGTAKEWGWDAE